MKIVAKIILSRLPFGYGLWQRLSLFRHGAMDDPRYILVNFQKHYDAAGRPGAGETFTTLELGPGDSLGSALVAKSLGGGDCWLIDSGGFARRDMATYRRIEAYLRQCGLQPPTLAGVSDVEHMLTLCDARYLITGLDGLRSIPDGSVDFIWSQAVLEHVRKREFLDTVQEMRRIVSDQGVCSHRVDLRDHLEGGLNNLRLRSSIWESEFFARSGFYTNRIGLSEMLEIFQSANFKVDLRQADRWSAPPLSSSRMAPEFQDRDDSDLCVSGFDVVLRPSC